METPLKSEKEENDDLRNLSDLSVSELMEFKDMVEEVYGEEVFQKLVEKECTSLFSKNLTSKIDVVEGWPSLEA